MTRVYLIRHADVENPGKVLYGHLPGFKLSPLGRAQAAALGVRLRGSGLRRILHSPLDRARETAEIISANLGAPVALEPDPQLLEAEFGRYLQGTPFWQIPLRRPLWLVHKARRGLLPGDETVEQMGSRVLAAMKRVAIEHPGEVSACVSHADPLQAAWILLDGRSHSEREMYRKPVDRAGVIQVDLEGGQVTAFEYLPPPKVETPVSAT